MAETKPTENTDSGLAVRNSAKCAHRCPRLYEEMAQPLGAGVKTNKQAPTSTAASTNSGRLTKPGQRPLL